MSIEKITRSFLLIILFLPVLAVAKESHLAKLQRMIDIHTVIVQKQVLRNWTLPPDAATPLSCVVEVQMTMEGKVTDTRIVSSSGNPDFDRSGQAAVTRSSPLPVVTPAGGRSPRAFRGDYDDLEAMAQFSTLEFEFRLGASGKALSNRARSDRIRSDSARSDRRREELSAKGLTGGYTNYPQVQSTIFIDK
jgi:TonB family protein